MTDYIHLCLGQMNMFASSDRLDLRSIPTTTGKWGMKLSRQPLCLTAKNATTS